MTMYNNTKCVTIPTNLFKINNYNFNYIKTKIKMKKLKFIAIFLLFSCSSEIIETEEDCGCVKTTYYYKDISTEYIQHIDTYVLTIEDVPCSNEAFKELISENIYYTIRCDE